MDIQFNRCLGCMEELPQGGVCPHCGYNPELSEENPGRLWPGTILKGQYVVGKARLCTEGRTTYIGWDLNLNIKVEIKEYVPQKGEDPETGMGIFEAEAKNLARLSEFSQIKRIRSVVSENQHSYMILEYLEGLSLGEYVRQNGRMGEEKLFSIMEPMIWTLSQLHQLEVIHGKISADTLFYQPEEGTLRIGEPAGLQELSNSSEPAGPWVDVYAVSTVLYFCLTGKYPIGNTPSFGEISLRGKRAETLKAGLQASWTDRPQTIEEFYRGLYGKELGPEQPAGEQKDKEALKKNKKKTEKKTPNGEKPPKWFLGAAAAAACLCVAVAAIGFNRGGSQPEKSLETEGETEEILLENGFGEAAITSGNAMNKGLMYKDPEGKALYFCDGFGTLFMVKAEDDGILYINDAKVLVPEGATYLNVTEDGLFYYNYLSGGIYSMDPDGGNITEIAEVPYYDPNEGDQIQDLHYIEEPEGNFFYYIEHDGGKVALKKLRDDGTAVWSLEETGYCLNIYEDYLYFIGEDLSVWKVEKGGTEKEQVYKGDSILSIQVCEDEIYMESSEGKSILVTDLSGNILREITEVDVYKSFNYQNGWLYFYSPEGKLCKSRKDGSNRIELSDKVSANIVVSEDSIYVIADEFGFQTPYFLTVDGSDEMQANPLNKDYMRGNSSSNLANEGCFWKVDPENGVYLTTDSARKLYKSSAGGFKLLYNGRVQDLNVYDGKAWFFADTEKIYSLDLETDELTVLADDTVAYNLTLVNDVLIFKNPEGIFRMDPETGEKECLYATDEDTRITTNMIVEDGNVFFTKNNKVYKLPYKEPGEPALLYDEETVYRVRAYNGRIYADTQDFIIEMDAEGNQMREFRNSFVPESNILGITDGWLYFANFKNQSIGRFSLATEETETLVEGIEGTVESFSVADDIVWFRVKDDEATPYTYEAYSFNLDGEVRDLEACYSVDEGIQAGI